MGLNKYFYKVKTDPRYFVRGKNGWTSEYLCYSLAKKKVEVVSNYFDDAELLR